MLRAFRKPHVRDFQVNQVHGADFTIDLHPGSEPGGAEDRFTAIVFLIGYSHPERQDIVIEIINLGLVHGQDTRLDIQVAGPFQILCPGVHCSGKKEKDEKTDKKSCKHGHIPEYPG